LVVLEAVRITSEDELGGPNQGNCSSVSPSSFPEEEELETPSSAKLHII